MQHTITAVQIHVVLNIASSAKMLWQHVALAWSQFMTWKVRRTTRQALNSLDDRTLADIGVPRSGIDAVVRDIEYQRTRWHLR